MIIRDFECDQCGGIFEEICDVEDQVFPCPLCKDGSGHKIISVGRVHTGNDDAEWIRSVTEVVNPEGGKAAREFIANPTRANRKRWMKEEGVRVMEKGEATRPAAPDMRKVEERVMRNHHQRMDGAQFRRYNERARKEGGRLNY